MAAFSRIKPGDILWDVHKYKTNVRGMSQTGTWSVRVIEIDVEKRRALCSWNSNSPRWYNETQLKRLKKNKPKER